MIIGKQNLKANSIYPKSLTSLRFFAVMFIVLHHLRIAFKPSIFSNPRFGNFGVIGVTFFLFLSGFVIALNYNKFSQAKESLYFIWNRLVRIYPIHICTFFICLIILYVWDQPIDIPTAIINILLLQSYFPLQNVFFSFNSVSWILSTLFFFYLVFAIVNHRPKCFFLLTVLSILCLIASMNYIEVNSKANDLWLLYIFPPNRLLVCLFGVVFSKLFLRFYKSLKNSMGKTPAAALEVISLLFIIDFIFWGYLTRFLNDMLLFMNFPFDKSLNLFTKHYVSTSIPTLLILISFGLEKGYLSRLLTKRFFVLLGEISFSIFMFHQLFFRVLKVYRRFLFDTFGQSFTIIILMLLVIPLSFPIYKFIEEPIRRKFRVNLRKVTFS